MEMPDKIYLNKYMIRKGMMYSAEPPYDVLEEEYILKDALLEWLEQEVLKLDVRSDNDAVAWGQRNAFKQVIDKLNSM